MAASSIAIMLSLQHHLFVWLVGDIEPSKRPRQNFEPRNERDRFLKEGLRVTVGFNTTDDKQINDTKRLRKGRSPYYFLCFLKEGRQKILL
jgi:hypothetical protein